MPDPVIVPPAPTVVQPSSPVDTSPGLEQVQRAFDRVLPEIKARPSPPKSAEAPSAPVTPPQQPVQPPVEKPPEKPAEPEKKPEHEVPSFLQEALKLEPSQPKVADVDAEWAEELPLEEKRSRIRNLREAYKKVKGELESAMKRPSMDEASTQRMAVLESQNKQMGEVLTRMGVEQSVEFQNEVMRPLHTSWGEAVRIVRESGGDPQGLVKAMSLSGKAQFEALDELLVDMPESAKGQLGEALRTYRRFEDVRRAAIANAPKTMEAIRQRETQRQYAEATRQKAEMGTMFDNALARLRDEAKVEVFMKSADPSSQWWNEQGEQIVSQARDLFLENTSLDRVAMACLLAPAADTYRKLFLTSQKKVAELQKLIKERIGNEPVLTESPGKFGVTPTEQMADDLKRPFNEVFLREFHKSQARNR